MLVQQVVMPSSRRRSWTVLGLDGVPVEPVERYLAFLTDVDRSPNTVKAYAHDLKDWFVFLEGRVLDWRGSAWRMWPSSWPGCGCRRWRGPGGSRCCRRCSRTAVRRR